MKWIKLTVTEELSNNLKLLASFKTTNISKLIKSFITNIKEYRKKDFVFKHLNENIKRKTVALQIEEAQEEKLIKMALELGLNKNQVLIKIIDN
jgi:hypothetical protein